MPTGNALIEDIDNWSRGPERLAFWWLGQSSVIVKLAGKIIYIDPYLSPNARRLTPPLLTPDQVTNADLVLCSHDHDDHIDPGSLPGIAAASPQATFVIPESTVERVMALGIGARRIQGINDAQTFDATPLTVTAIKAKHEFFDQTPEGNYPYLGYVLSVENTCLYYSGDTLTYDGLLSTLSNYDLSVAFVPINGRDAQRYQADCQGNMTYQEAVDLVGELAPRLAVPMHYDMFAFNSEDPKRFLEYLNAKYPKINAWVGSPGQRVEVAIS